MAASPEVLAYTLCGTAYHRIWKYGSTEPLRSKRAPAAGFIALRGFDLEHVRTMISQDLGTIRTRQNPAEVNHFQPVQRAVRCPGLIGFVCHC